MKKRDKIIYWLSTLWLSLGMLSTGIVQLFHVQSGIEPILKMGYPVYFLTILGLWKILGVVALVVPKTPLIKEWAYAGFFFAMTGAVFSHIIIASPIGEILPSLLLLLLTIVSWHFRPADRKILARTLTTNS